MERIELNEQVSFSRIIQGMWRLISWGLPKDRLRQFLEERIERGVTTFDTAEIYDRTECEKQMGRVLADAPELRSRMEIVTKTGIFEEKDSRGNTFTYYDTTYDRIIRSCEGSLRRLNTDYIDVYLIHREDPCIDFEQVARALDTLQQRGLIKAYGVSNFDPFKFDAINKAADGKLVTNQIEWSPLCFEHFESGMIDYLTVRKIRPMIWSPLAGGELFNPKSKRAVRAMSVIESLAKKYGCGPETVIYAWLMYHPVGAMPIVGSRKIERLELAMEALNLRLEHADWYKIYLADGENILR